MQINIRNELGNIITDSIDINEIKIPKKTLCTVKFVKLYEEIP